MAQYGKASYWDERYTKDPEPFDWYQRYSGIKDLLAQYVRGLLRPGVIMRRHLLHPCSMPPPVRLVAPPTAHVRRARAPRHLPTAHADAFGLVFVPCPFPR